MKRGYVEVPVRIVRETDKALLCELCSGPSPPSRTQCWIPKSQVDGENSTAESVGDEGTLVIPEWLYDAKMEEVALAYGPPTVHVRGLEDVIEEKKKKGEWP